MKIKEFISDLSEISDGNIKSKGLERIKDILLYHTEEFNDVKELIIIDTPSMKDVDENIYDSVTISVKEDTKLTGKVYLYEIYLSPLTWDVKSFTTPVKNGASISPVIYDEIDFSPNRRIMLSWSPAMAQDLTTMTNNHILEDGLRILLHETLDDVLDNPKDYMYDGTRSVMIRGIFNPKEILINI